MFGRSLPLSLFQAFGSSNNLSPFILYTHILACSYLLLCIQCVLLGNVSQCRQYAFCLELLLAFSNIIFFLLIIFLRLTYNALVHSTFILFSAFLFENVAQSWPLFVYCHPILNTMKNIVQNLTINGKSLGFKPGSAALQAQTNPLSYSGPLFLPFFYTFSLTHSLKH